MLTSHNARRTTDNGRRKTDKRRSQKLTMSTLCSEKCDRQTDSQTDSQSANHKSPPVKPSPALHNGKPGLHMGYDKRMNKIIIVQHKGLRSVETQINIRNYMNL
ncbi:hypothetical protein DPMN_090400 [Dreissena polymorpha]|uniref:Uncharacterized protein n=1 Tax=Dreissena polymorpha TaxID=45954 RepID=A0A9D4QZ09_DREPO|nr:hypothetical protein DPMN_090400 [Dreissena polymorpha]